MLNSKTMIANLFQIFHLIQTLRLSYILPTLKRVSNVVIYLERNIKLTLTKAKYLSFSLRELFAASSRVKKILSLVYNRYSPIRFLSD